MLTNAAEIQILQDTGNQVAVKVSGYFTSANTSNTKVIVANTLFGANASKTLNDLSLTGITWTGSITSNGVVSLQYHSTVNTNTSIMNFTGSESFPLYQTYVRNNANTPSGDINLQMIGVGPNSAYTLIAYFNKEKGNQGPNSDAWANTENGY